MSMSLLSCPICLNTFNDVKDFYVHLRLEYITKEEINSKYIVLGIFTKSEIEKYEEQFKNNK